ncbi:hypothetical protein ACFOD0_03890 [Shewanella intestini]|uniref:Secreted protein n=1 Tax=Shewanella intestini TaxID=2017544 RepID=A0ABS5I3U4_9GAMM|nr:MULTISPECIES: hypothetical protein [Shewanella]MBR9728493.1 hypothetical protein [Shewanella intestini]MRG36312.1 hypothetical protein [Shewanella sp. XMDDZSB0408]
MTYKKIKNRILSSSVLAVSLLMTASTSATIIECNDCSDEQHVNTIKNQPAGDVFVVDFVHRTIDKYRIFEQGSHQKIESSLSEVININQKFAHRKTQLRAPIN